MLEIAGLCPGHLTTSLKSTRALFLRTGKWVSKNEQQKPQIAAGMCVLKPTRELMYESEGPEFSETNASREVL